MQEIEIRRVVEAERAIAITANPAVVPGVNGEPDEVVIALEIATLGDERNGTGRSAFALPLSAFDATVDALVRAHLIAGSLVEDLQ